MAPLAPVVAAHRHARVVEADPRAGHQARVHEDEPAVGVVLRGAGLAGHVGLGDAEPRAHHRARALRHHAAQHVDEGDRRVGRHRTPRRRAEIGDDAPLAVADALDDERLAPHAFVRDGGVGVDHLQQRDRARAQRERGHRVEPALAHAGGAGQSHHTVDAHVLHHLRGDDVARVHEPVAQGHRHTARGRHVGGLPHAAVGASDFDRLVEVGALRADAAFERGAVDQRLEGRARLARGLCHVVVLVLREVAAADPGLHLAGRRVHRHETGFEARLAGLEGRDPFLVGQQFPQGLRFRRAGLHRAAELGRFAYRGGQQLGALLPEVAERLCAAWQPGAVERGLHQLGLAPFDVGDLLQRFGLSRNGLLGGALQVHLERAFDHQAVGVQVMPGGLGPGQQPLACMAAEVRRRAGRVGIAVEAHLERLCGELPQACSFQRAALLHLRQHQVAPLAGALGVEHRVVVARALEHAHERGAFHLVQLRSGLVEIGAGGHLHTHRVEEKRCGVEVGLEDLALAVELLDAQGRHQLLELAVQRAAAADLFGEEVARQLLRERGAALRAADAGVVERGHEPLVVDAAVLMEAVVFGGEQRLDEMRRYLVDGHPLRRPAAEGGERFAIGREQHRGAGRGDFTQVLHARRVADEMGDIGTAGHGGQEGAGHPGPECDAGGLPSPRVRRLWGKWRRGIGVGGRHARHGGTARVQTL